MNVVFRTVMGGVPLIVLVAAGLAHGRRMAALREDLVSHDTLPRAIVSAAAFAIVVMELALGTAGIVAWAVDHAAITSRLLAVVGGLYVAFALYSTVVLVLRPGVNCGCGHLETRINALVPARALLLAILSVWASADPPTLAALANPYRAALSLIPAVALAVLLRVAPDAVGTPPLDEDSRFERDGAVA